MKLLRVYHVPRISAKTHLRETFKHELQVPRLRDQYADLLTFLFNYQEEELLIESGVFYEVMDSIYSSNTHAIRTLSAVKETLFEKEKIRRRAKDLLKTEEELSKKYFKKLICHCVRETEKQPYLLESDYAREDLFYLFYYAKHMK